MNVKIETFSHSRVESTNGSFSNG